ncbi:malto-oligosyltrehalose trehalohydrolase [Limnoglobus roseus]|uniref:Malto-oligosyltrehalose trehalohydrolase n=1 Tax=Limnoglobus roseus TaxID=2598579 RepID=A0A5C1ANN1_9BACT|nr:malto-oligosyltrehalose trehalohydrolase [Limnoglobus roseus]QEL19747.1 retaining malto-oligosyltrehalose trehalohydrolase [Limnoglobus roseus]
MKPSRRYPIGAEASSEGSTHFRVWAPDRKKVVLVIEQAGNPQAVPMQAEDNGYFSISAPAGDGTRYRFELDGEGPFPDPASRFQPEGPHGPSQVVDPTRFRWTDSQWRGTELRGQVVYELHVGTFTAPGTWAAATEQLAELAAVGITCLEVMPVNDFCGRYGWGYDGVNEFAPTRLYGTPDDFRRFVDVAHAHGLGVILDVVYNHLGPDGNYLEQYAKDYFTDKHKTDWGKALNFDGANNLAVREFFTANAAYWIDEYHLDGLRLDATQNIYDDAPPPKHILADIGRAVRKAANGRATIIVNENECQHSELVRPTDRGGYGLDALWNDDYHHAALVALTGKAEAYYHDYRGDAQEFVSAIKYGYLYQGQWYSWQEQRRGHAGLDLPPPAFINFLENHDQVANSGRGLRAHQMTSPGRYRAMYALTLLGPGTPMLFQGQEFSAATPFFYFADHVPELGKLIRAGRIEFLHQFTSLKDADMLEYLACPTAEATFQACKLDFRERERNQPAYQLTKDLLKLRRTEPAFQAQATRGVDGAVLGPQAFVLRYFQPDGDDRLVLVNLGRELRLETCPEPLLAPPFGCEWSVLLSTDAPQYGGSGSFSPETVDKGWRLAGECATVLTPRPETKPKVKNSPSTGEAR